MKGLSGRRTFIEKPACCPLALREDNGGAVRWGTEGRVER